MIVQVPRTPPTLGPNAAHALLAIVLDAHARRDSAPGRATGGAAQIPEPAVEARDGDRRG